MSTGSATWESYLEARERAHIKVLVLRRPDGLQRPTPDALVAVLGLDADALEVSDRHVLVDLLAPDASPLARKALLDLALVGENSRGKVARFLCNAQKG